MQLAQLFTFLFVQTRNFFLQNRQNQLIYL